MSLDSIARIDAFPTHRIAGYRVRPGKPFPYGATLMSGGINFSIYSDRASAVTLVLFEKGAREPLAELPYPPAFRVGSVYAMTVYDLDPEALEYGFRAEGPFEPARGDRFDASKVLSDPYARLISGRDVWGKPPDWSDPYQHRSRVLLDDFDWGDDQPLDTPLEDLVVYETHVRGFTRHPSAGVTAPGTFAGLREKIPYLVDLGVNAVELLPVFEFDELANPRRDPRDGKPLLDYWGYNTVAFFAPKAGYAASGRYGMQADEFKSLVKSMHAAGIEVILDVVFNHTAEGNGQGPTISFRGLDNATYYMLTADGYYYNFSGTGNTVNCNHPVVRDFILGCLRHWVAEYHVDGFRFDLASILDRAPDGSPLPNPPLLEQLAHDPVLRRSKLIAEAWDAAGLYQVGSFPSYGRWSEWNGRYRDTVRRFVKGDPGTVGDLATRLLGSPDLYEGRGPAASINFVTAHDGFTLHDLVTYDVKHNEANGEGNRDGADDNNSWNHGIEGPSDSEGVRTLRRRQMKNAMTVLLTSHGVPMLLAGDEVGRTQQGNNNTYCQDNELSWFDWRLTRDNAELLRFVRGMIAFRRAHPVLRSPRHLRGTSPVDGALPDVSWHGVRAWSCDWSWESHLLGMMLCGHDAQTADQVGSDRVYVVFNAHWQPHEVELPSPGSDYRWHLVSDTAAAPPDDLHPLGQEPELADQERYVVAEHASLVLVGRPVAASGQHTDSDFHH